MTEEETSTRKEEEVAPSSLKSGNYLSFKEGETIERFELDKVLKVTGDDPEYNLSKRDFKYELVGKDGKKISVNAWAFVNALGDAIGDLETAENVTLKLEHVKKGEYRVTKL